MYYTWSLGIYSVDTSLYLYALPIDFTLIIFSSLYLSYNLSQAKNVAQIFWSLKFVMC